MSYARNNFLSFVISAARARVRDAYSLGRKPSDMQKNIEWLLEKSHFMYGEVDVKVCAVTYISTTI